MLMEQIKCKVCGELDFVQIGTETAAAKLCYGCEEEYGIDVRMCEDCGNNPITRENAEYCEECMDSDKQSREWEKENKAMLREYISSVL